MDFKTQLVNELINNLKIEKGIFSVGMIEDSLDGISPDNYADFFNAVMGDEHEYLKPLDRIAKVAKHFKCAHADELFKESHSMAKTFYNKIYAVNAQMTTYTQENRDKVPNDREFFVNMDYSKLSDKDSFKVFSKQDLYILSELGGGEWLMNIKFLANEKEALEKIERIIKTAITSKYLAPKHEAISHEVRKMLK